MISIIVAASDNNVIGKDNQLIWKQSNDLKRFKELTSGKTVIMGRKTYESIGKPLPNRINIVVSRNEKLLIKNVLTVTSIEDAIRKSPRDRDIFIIGGGEIYKESLKYANTIYMTRIHNEFDGDSYFENSDKLFFDGFRETDIERFDSDENNEYDYSYITYKRN